VATSTATSSARSAGTRTYVYACNRPLRVVDPAGRWYDDIGIEAAEGFVLGAILGLAAPVLAGTSVTFTAAADQNMVFGGWGGACSGMTTCTVTADVARLVVATFTPTPVLHISTYHLDALGSVRAVTDETGAVLRRHDYFPFGEEYLAQPGTDTRRFTGKDRDAETGLDYFEARYFGSRIGRFTTVDPGHVDGNLFQPQSWNADAYADISKATR
jgi:RHS repeat-associated protein